MKIKVTRKQFNVICTAYRVIGFFIILSLIICVGILLNKPVNCMLILLSYFASRKFYNYQAHCKKSMLMCLAITFTTFIVCTEISPDISNTLMGSAFIGLMVSYICSKINNDNCYRYVPICINNNLKESVLRNKCDELKLSSYTTELAVQMFIHNIDNKILAEQESVNLQSIATQKYRLKEKLETTKRIPK